MSKPKRFDDFTSTGGGMKPAFEGKYITYAHHVAAMDELRQRERTSEEENQRLCWALDAMESAFTDYALGLDDIDVSATIEAIRAKLAASRHTKEEGSRE